jgi:predicted Zn-dependent protease
LGEAVDIQVRSLLDKGRLGTRFECGTADAEKPGRAALDRLVAKLAASAGLQVPLAVAVVRRREANAIALPGGHIYVFQGLVAKADSADELAGVLAHELGHIAQRDGTRAVLQAAGLSFLFGMLLGDFVGGGAVVVAARTVLQSSYSRDVEAAADTYGVGLMVKIGGNPRALATMLSKIEPTEPALKILLDHPETKDRVDAINAAAPASSGAALLDPADWAALKRICAAR